MSDAEGRWNARLGQDQRLPFLPREREAHHGLVHGDVRTGVPLQVLDRAPEVEQHVIRSPAEQERVGALEGRGDVVAGAVVTRTLAQPPRSNPFLRSSSVEPPLPWVTPSSVIWVIVVSFIRRTPAMGDHPLDASGMQRTARHESDVKDDEPAAIRSDRAGRYRRCREFGSALRPFRRAVAVPRPPARAHPIATPMAMPTPTLPIATPMATPITMPIARPDPQPADDADHRDRFALPSDTGCSWSSMPSTLRRSRRVRDGSGRAPVSC
ncbi:hypothetical protein [Pseudolysinimonas kribbensis]|uniref:hypothetical protein n=1 Tax=Pseudolysinimonas kribbensis TaxID=433641 RepID=UPI0024E0C931|nr:hypothetical protein [Pseudolysinimonas kribbensis]